MSVDLGGKLSRVLTRRGPDGGLAHGDAAVQGFVPLMYLEIARADPSVKIPDEARRALVEWLAPDGELPSDEKLASMLAARMAQPDVVALRTEIEAALREALAESGGDAGLLARFAGEQRVTSALEGERPEGTIAAGPLARFLMND